MDSTADEVEILKELVQLLREEVRYLKIQIEEVRTNTKRTFEEVYDEIDDLDQRLCHEIKLNQTTINEELDQVHVSIREVSSHIDGR